MRDLLKPLRRLSDDLKVNGVQSSTALMIAEYLDQSIAEIESLRQQLADCQKECEEEARLNGAVTALEHLIPIAAPTIPEETEKDAARYRWLREQTASGGGYWVAHGMINQGLSQWNGDPLDKSIDAAMTPNKGEQP